MPITLVVGGRGGRAQFIEWAGPPGTDPTLGSFARVPKNPVPLPQTTVGTLQWTSDTPAVVTVDGSGNLTAVAPGQAFIICVDQTNGLRAIDRVTVVAPQPRTAGTLTLINN